MLPGEAGRRREELQLIRGVEVDDRTWAELIEIAADLGVAEIPAAEAV